MNTTKKLTTLAVTCSLVLGILPAAFADNSDKHFKAMDTNGDGKISRAEHAAHAKQMFSECDANRDGIVTAAEMDASLAAKGEKPGKGEKTALERIQMLDQN